MSLAEHYENLYSKSIPTSDISRINAHPGEYVTVDPDIITLLQTACEYASLSDGAIDPSIGAVSSLWDFHETTDPAIPSDDVLSEALTHVDYRKISIKDQGYCIQGFQVNGGFIISGIRTLCTPVQHFSQNINAYFPFSHTAKINSVGTRQPYITVQ